MPVGSKDEALWDAGEVAAFLKVDQDSVYRWVSQGRIPHVKVGRLTRFKPDAIREVAERGLPTEGAA
jgi:excisionase family DNA binding protein